MLERKYFQVISALIFLLIFSSTPAAYKSDSSLIRFNKLKIENLKDLARLENMEENSNGNLLSFIKYKIAGFYFSKGHHKIAYNKLIEILDTQSSHSITIKALRRIIKYSELNNDKNNKEKYMDLLEKLI